MNAITGKTFDQDVVQADKPVLIDFHAVWCGPCRMVSPILEEIARERQDLTIVKVDVDQESELARRHTIMSVPTLVLYHKGKAVATWVGLRSKQALLQDIDKALVA